MDDCDQTEEISCSAVPQLISTGDFSHVRLPLATCAAGNNSIAEDEQFRIDSSLIFCVALVIALCCC